MRRKDREMSAEFGLQLIDKTSFGTLCVTDQAGNPFAIPLSLVRKDNLLYFHSAVSGTKTELLQNGTQVTLVFVVDHQVPNITSKEEARAMMENPERIRNLTRQIFTTEFESAIVRGTIRSITDPTEKMEGLRLICEKYTPDWMDFFEAAANSSFKITGVYAIHIDEITAKRKKLSAPQQ